MLQLSFVTGLTLLALMVPGGAPTGASSSGPLPILVVDPPAGCVCAGTLVGNYSQQPTPVYCGAVPCISFTYGDAFPDREKKPGICTAAGEPPCPDKDDCQFPAQKVTVQLAACATGAICGVKPLRIVYGGGSVGKKLQVPGDKDEVPVTVNNIGCGGEPKSYVINVEDSSPTPQVQGQFTITASCKQCPRLGG